MLVGAWGARADVGLVARSRVWCGSPPHPCADSRWLCLPGIAAGMWSLWSLLAWVTLFGGRFPTPVSVGSVCSLLPRLSWTHTDAGRDET